MKKITAEKSQYRFWRNGGCDRFHYLLEIDGARAKPEFWWIAACFQGSRVAEEKNSEPFLISRLPLTPCLSLTPTWIMWAEFPSWSKMDSRAKIYSTYPTKDFAKLMLIDSIGVLSKEAKKDGRNQPIYQEEDVEKAMSLWEAKNYRESFEIDGINVLFKDAGHILGSAMIEITNSESEEGKAKKEIGFYRRLGQSSGTAYQPHGNYR